MIFNSCCDRALWLISISSDNYRDKIIDFINSIPLNFMDKIKDALVLFDKYESDNVDLLDREINDLSEELFVSNNYKYWFNVDMISGTLNIGRSFKEIKDIEITLFFNNRYKKNDDMILGYVDFNNNVISFELINTVLGDRVVASLKNGIKRYKKVSIDKIPTDIEIVDLEKKNRFVRSRCRKLL